MCYNTHCCGYHYRSTYVSSQSFGYFFFLAQVPYCRIMVWDHGLKCPFNFLAIQDIVQFQERVKMQIDPYRQQEYGYFVYIRFLSFRQKAVSSFLDFLGRNVCISFSKINIRNDVFTIEFFIPNGAAVFDLCEFRLEYFVSQMRREQQCYPSLL